MDTAPAHATDVSITWVLEAATLILSLYVRLQEVSILHVQVVFTVVYQLNVQHVTVVPVM